MGSRRAGLVILAALTACTASLVWGATSVVKGPGTLVIHQGVTAHKSPGAPVLRFKPSLTAAATGTVFSDNFDGTFPGANWTFYQGSGSTNWGQTTYRKYSGTKSIYCAAGGASPVSPPGPYPTNFEGWITYGPFSTVGATTGSAIFKLWNVSEQDNDVVFAGWSTDDVDYDGLTWSGSGPSWTTDTLHLTESGFTYHANYAGQSQVYFSLYFSSNGAITYEGAYVDDLSITTAGTTTKQTVGGLIKDEYGRPLPGVTISCNNGGGTVQSGIDGKYSFRLAPGSYKLVPKRPGYTLSPLSKVITVASSTVTVNFTGTQALGDGVVNYYAVIVGIADYEGTANDLNYCDDDARDLKASLVACGWPAANITMLIDAQGTKAAIKAAVASMASKADADDVCLFFQSSHGGQITDVAPLDEADNKDEVVYCYKLSTEWIRDDELGEWLNALKTSKYVVFIDACNSGGMIKSVAPTPQGFSFGADIAYPGGMIGTADIDDNFSGAVVTACRDTELSEESGSLQNGIFAYYLCQGIDTGGADANGDGWVSAEEVFNYARPRVTKLNPEQTLDLFEGGAVPLNFAQLPTVIQTSIPARNAVNVATSSKITLTFRNNVNKTSAQGRFRLLDGNGTSLAGTFTWPTATKVMRFTPNAALKVNQTYTVRILPGLVLADATIVPRGESFTFRTSATGLAQLAVTGTAAMTAAGTAQISVNLSAAATVSATIFNLAGRTVASLPEQSLERGVSTLLWDGKSALGTRVPTGQYLVRMQAADGSGSVARCLVPLRK